MYLNQLAFVHAKDTPHFVNHFVFLKYVAVCLENGFIFKNLLEKPKFTWYQSFYYP